VAGKCVTDVALEAHAAWARSFTMISILHNTGSLFFFCSVFFLEGCFVIVHVEDKLGHLSTVHRKKLISDGVL
jgi:hypothetical protein